MAEEQIDVEKLAELTGTEKSAILMMLLGEEEAAQVLTNLSPREVQHLGTAMYSVTGVDQATVNMVLDEFLETIKKQTGLGLGAGRYIENVMVRALGEDKAQTVLGKITPSDSNPLTQLIMFSRCIPGLKSRLVGST